MRSIRVRAPTRIDLGGGWTDVPPYCTNEGGFVCNLAIDRYAVASVHDGEVTGDVPHSAFPTADTPLVNATLRRAGVTGACVAAESDFPLGAGLGGSSTASAALLGAIAAWTLFRSFTDTVEVRRIALSSATKKEFEHRSFLVYTGESRISGRNITEVIRAYEAREPRVIVALARMRTLAEEISASLGEGDLDSVGALVDEHWHHQRALHPAIPTPVIDEIVRRAAASGALGSKAMGASGGGCVLVIAGKHAVDRVRAAIAPLGAIIPFRLDSEGLARCE
jgi:D-glycero-alpha-D-manno-heptose-7-phosphate kinase